MFYNIFTREILYFQVISDLLGGGKSRIVKTFQVMTLTTGIHRSVFTS